MCGVAHPGQPGVPSSDGEDSVPVSVQPRATTDILRLFCLFLAKVGISQTKWLEVDFASSVPPVVVGEIPHSVLCLLKGFEERLGGRAVFGVLRFDVEKSVYHNQ